MRLQLLKLCFLLCLSLSLFACDGGGGGSNNLADNIPTDPTNPTEPTGVVQLDITSDNYFLNIEGADSSTLTIFTRDATNVAFEGIVVSLSATGGTLVTDTVTTDATGTAQVKFSSAPETESQVVTITATIGSESESKVIAITLSTTSDTTNAESLDITTDHYTLNADGSEQAILTIYARDANNAALEGVSVYLNATAGFLSSSTVTTDATGKANVTFSPGPDDINQVATITATSGSLSTSLAITLVVPPPTVSAVSIRMTTSKSQLNTNGEDFATITVYAQDANNAPVGDVVIIPSATAGYLSTSQVTTNDTGTAIFTFSPGADTTNQVATITASSGSLSTSLAITFVGISDPACQMILTSDLTPGTQLSQGGEVTINATVSDDNDFNLEDGNLVTFQVFPPTAGLINQTAETFDGVASVTFKAGVSSGGLVTVRGTTPGVECGDFPVPIDVYDDLSFEIASGASSAITFVSADPATVGVRSSGQPESTTLTFQVLNDGGSPVADGTPVTFSIATPLGGGEALTSNQNTTINGYVQVALQSGTVSGTVAVKAAIENSSPPIETTGKVIIVSGLTDSNHFGLATTQLNLPGYDCFGESATITAYVADRYANPVPVNTPVYFTSEAGAMVMDSTNIDPAFTDGYGQATAEHVTQPPTPDTISTVTGLIGATTILAWTEGQEAFVDVNGNGLYDNSEPFDDFGEPFIDANDNDTYDATDERYIDSNGNGQYDGPNGIWDGDTFVWNTIDILWSSLAVNMNVTPSFDCQDFVISDGQSCTITVEVTDSNDNPIIGGSTISIIPDIFIEGEANITPNSLFPEYTIPDANRTGLDTTLFKYAIRNVAGGSAGSFDGAVNLDVPGVCTSAFQKTRTFNVTLEAPTP